jgi:hypothetical protein
MEQLAGILPAGADTTRGYVQEAVLFRPWLFHKNIVVASRLDRTRRTPYSTVCRNGSLEVSSNLEGLSVVREHEREQLSNAEATGDVMRG